MFFVLQVSLTSQAQFSGAVLHTEALAASTTVSSEGVLPSCNKVSLLLGPAVLLHRSDHVELQLRGVFSWRRKFKQQIECHVQHWFDDLIGTRAYVDPFDFLLRNQAPATGHEWRAPVEGKYNSNKQPPQIKHGRLPLYRVENIRTCGIFNKVATSWPHIISYHPCRIGLQQISRRTAHIESDEEGSWKRRAWSAVECLAEEGRWMVQAPPHTIVVDGRVWLKARSKEPRSGCRCARWFVSKVNFELLHPSSIATHRDRILTIYWHIIGSSGCVGDQKSFRECGYTYRFAVHRHFAVADAWGWRGEKINGSQASRNCYGPTHSLIDASRAVALVRCFGGFRERGTRRRLDERPKRARLIRQDVPSLSPLCVDPCEAMLNYIMKVSGNNRVARHDIRFCSAHDTSTSQSRKTAQQKCLLEDVGHDADGRAVACWVKD
ncbi:hypothetical protein KCU81_g875, partial [Aureobasidium melanogenum]